MQNETSGICLKCNRRVAVAISATYESVTVRGVSFRYIHHTARCSACGSEVYVPDISDDNAYARELAYKKAVRK